MVVLAGILGFTACTALVQSINGGGGSKEEKAAAMVARASGALAVFKASGEFSWDSLTSVLQRTHVLPHASCANS